MWQINTCLVKKLSISDPDQIRNDPEIVSYINEANSKLGKKGCFVLNLAGLPQESSILAEGKNKKICKQYIEGFEKLLIKKGYMDHEHDWIVLQETDYGEMDYNSYGGGVEHFIVTLYRCSLCGALHKEYRGDFNGDPAEFLEISNSDIALAEQADK